LEHVAVFAREQLTALRATEIDRIRSDLLQQLALDDGITAHQHAIEARAETADPIAAVDPPISRHDRPCRASGVRSAPHEWYIRAANEIDGRIREGRSRWSSAIHDRPLVIVKSSRRESPVATAIPRIQRV
jgi:hypothetical protein